MKIDKLKIGDKIRYKRLGNKYYDSADTGVIKAINDKIWLDSNRIYVLKEDVICKLEEKEVFIEKE